MHVREVVFLTTRTNNRTCHSRDKQCRFSGPSLDHSHDLLDSLIQFEQSLNVKLLRGIERINLCQEEITRQDYELFGCGLDTLVSKRFLLNG